MKFRMLTAALCAAMISACGGGSGGPGPVPDAPTVQEPAPGSTPQPLATSSLALSVAAPSEAVPAGTTATVTLTLGNAGPAAATDVQITPNLGRGLVLGAVSCSAAGGAACPGDPTSLALSSLPASGTITLQVQVGVAEGSSGDIVSTPVVTAGNDASLADNIALALLRTYSADLAVTATGPALPVASGNVAGYTMSVTNTGPDTARQVAIVNTLGAAQSLGIMACSAGGGATCPVALGPSMVIPALPRGGTLAFTVPATVAANTAGSIANALAVTSAGDPQSTNNSASAQASAFIVPPLAPVSITLASDRLDYIGSGRSYAYTLANSAVTATSSGNRFSIQVTGDERWQADFVLPAALAQFAPGTYANLARYPFHNAVVGGLNWSGEGRGCNQLSGSFTVNSARYDAGQLSGIDLDFEQHCEGAAQALRGHVAWSAGDATLPPGPVNPLPANLWEPGVAMPASGNYVYLESDAGDFIGNGQRTTYTNANAVLTVTGSGNTGSVRVTGNKGWSGDFQAMNSLAQLQPGYYGNLARQPFHNPVRGGLSWSGDGRACNTLSGWFVVDNVIYANGSLQVLDLRFEQHCEGMVPALRGKIHYAPGDSSTPSGPANPPPGNLWAPPAASLPASGNYVYLASDPGDYIGQGVTATYTPAAGAFSANSNAGLLSVYAAGWNGSFLAMNTLQRLEPGYYGNLQRYPFNNPVTGGLSWYGQGRGCNTLDGWFVVDSVTYAAGVLAALDLRFEQHCEGESPALRGAVHWAQ